MSLARNIGEFDSCLDQALFVLLDDVAGANDGWRSAAEISAVLRDRYLINQHWRSIEHALQSAKDKVSRRKISKRWHYKITAAGKTHLTGHARVRLLNPARQVESMIAAHELLVGLSGTVRVCDPYLDHQTIHILDAVPGPSTVRLLTKNVRDNGKLRSLISAYNSNGRKLEIRVSKAPLHDRYIIDAKKLLILGCSLNGIGKSQSMLIEAGQDIKASLLVTFDANWVAASEWR